MAYEKQTWKNGEDGNTPLTADRLNHIEDGIAEKAKQGPKGEPGKDGSDGSKGVGVDDITRSGNTLVFTMSDDSEIEVDLPSDDSGDGE